MNLDLIPSAHMGLTMLTLVTMILFLRHWVRNARLFYYPVLVWLVLTLLLARGGMLTDGVHLSPIFPVLIGIQFFVVLYVTLFSRVGRALLVLPQVALVAIQVFRLGVELILAALASQGAFPVELTFHGINWDIFMGVAALPVAVLIPRLRDPLRKHMLLAWNIVGLILLFNIVGHAFFAAPTPLQALHYSVDTRRVAEVPYLTLPFFLVPLALAGHLISLRSVLRERTQRPS